MYSFRNDYSEGAHPNVMARLLETNQEQSVGYGEDSYCEQARKQIRDLIQCPSCDVHFLVGGTQANLTVIAAALRPYEAVIAVESGHINVHETGAIEASGHKVVTVSGERGKITPQKIRAIVAQHEDEHMVKPAMVYISNATEIGTIYTKAELEAIYTLCQELDLYLFIDGARLGAAIAAQDNDISFADLPKLCDVFYIGGTKNGALFGEALVIVNNALKKDFRFMIKQRGGMLAKGRLLGLQFSALLEDGLYLQLAAHANAMAQKLQAAMKECGIAMLVETSTNQIFPIFPNTLKAELEKEFAFQKWETMDETHTAVRFVTSWACDEQQVDACIAAIQRLTKQ